MTENQRLIDWVRQDLHKHELRIEGHLEEIQGQFESINRKVDDLVELKWKLLGGTVVASGIVGVTIQIFMAILAQKLRSQ